MNILISNKISTPIYEQIENQIKDMIIQGELKAGDPLPSLRFLAKELRISLITTKRAYEDLERDGFIETRVGIGCFVKAQSENIIKEQIMCNIENLLGEAVILAKRYEISLDEITDTLKLLYDEQVWPVDPHTILRRTKNDTQF